MVRKIFVYKEDKVTILISVLNKVIIWGVYESVADIFDSLSDYRSFKKKSA